MSRIEIVKESIQLIKMSDEEYFSSKYKGYVSNSGLGLIDPKEDGSGEKFESGFKSAYSSSFELGSAVHAMLLQKEFFTISHIRKPSGKLGVFAEQVFKLRLEGYTIQNAIDKASLVADYYVGKLSKVRLTTAIRSSISFYLSRIKLVEELGKQTLFLSDALADKYEFCMLGLNGNSKIQELLNPGEEELVNVEIFNEYAIFCEVDFTDDDGVVTRVKLKGKLDNFTINHDSEEVTLNDLKTTGKPAKFFMGNYVKVINEEYEESDVWVNGSFQKYHYGRQMGVYGWLLQCALKQLYNLDYKLKVNMLVVETIPNYNSKVFVVNGNYIKEGLKEFKQLLTLVVKWVKLK